MAVVSDGVVETSGMTERGSTMTDRLGIPVPRSSTELASTRHARAELSRATHRGAITEIVAACLALVEIMIRGHRALAASWVLEQTLLVIDRLDDRAPRTAEAIWNLMLTLAVLYESLGERGEARDMACVALATAVRADSETGRERALDVLQRLVGTTQELELDRPLRAPCSEYLPAMP
jgi:hypothetical protein